MSAPPVFLPPPPKNPNDLGTLKKWLYLVYLSVFNAAGVSFPIAIAEGGTGATTLSQAQTNLDITPLPPAGDSDLVLQTDGGNDPVWSAFKLIMGGDITTDEDFTVSGAFTTILTVTGATNITLPTTGTLATTALSGGGTNASLTASNGGIVYSTATALAILSGTATAGQLLLSGSSTTPSWSTTTYPSTNAINTIPYASSANVIGVITAAANSVLTSNGSNVPSLTTTRTTSYSPTIAGFSVDPSTIVSRYFLIGKKCTVIINTNNGTSNATTFTITAPFTSVNNANQDAYVVGVGVNNGADVLSIATLPANSNVITLYNGLKNGAWDNTGNKGASFELTFEVA